VDKKYLVSVSQYEAMIIKAESYWVTAEGTLEFSVVDPTDTMDIVIATFRNWAYVCELDRISNVENEDE
jgi:hypothetical protein